MQLSTFFIVYRATVILQYFLHNQSVFLFFLHKVLEPIFELYFPFFTLHKYDVNMTKVVFSADEMAEYPMETVMEGVEDESSEEEYPVDDSARGDLSSKWRTCLTCIQV